MRLLRAGVACSAEDAPGSDFSVTVIADACRGIWPPDPNGRTTIDAARDRFSAHGVRFIESGTI
ncbi:MAG: hypothetical protein ABSC06_30815 [Rhodopila sp.]|jgi:nicotinamidase-related amidase